MPPEAFDLAPLARRIERVNAAQLERARAARGVGSPAVGVAGGLAVCHGARSPFSAAVGLAIGTPATPADVDRVEAHLGIGGGPVRIEVGPCTDPSLTEELGRRGYQVERFFQVWVRAPAAEAPGADVRPAAPAETAARVDVVTPPQVGAPPWPGRPPASLAAMLSTEGAVPWLALEGGRPVGVALSSSEAGVAWLSGAGVLPAFRGRRLQAALVRARLAWAHAAGCDLVASATEPGTASQRTLERCGFRAAYPKAVLVR